MEAECGKFLEGMSFDAGIVSSRCRGQFDNSSI